MSKYGGFASNKASMEDNRRIGELLGYSKSSIDKYIADHYDENGQLKEINLKKAAAIGAMGLATLGSPKAASGQNFQGLKDKFKAGVTAIKDKITPQQKVDTVKVQKDAPLALEKFKDYHIAGHVTLTRGERSELATIASEIL